MKTIKLWDAPLRIFHWLLAGLVIAAFITGLTGGSLMDWHGRIGGGIAGLIGFRLAWGALGSTYSRFTTFIKGPSAIAAYLRGQWHGVGHNPLGALSVIAKLGALLLQVLTGLVSNDDIAFSGPYNSLVSKDTELLAIYWHKNIVWLIGILISLHLAAIFFYVHVKKDNLITPMITGEKTLPSMPPSCLPAQECKGGGWVALGLSLVFSGVVAWAAWGGAEPYLLPPPPPPAYTPNW